MQIVRQLSFDVFAGGGTPTFDGEPVRPLATTISVTGGFDLEEFYSQESGMPELAHGEVVLVSLSTADGQVIAHGQGEVEIAFASKVVEGRKIPIRKQKVKL